MVGSGEHLFGLPRHSPGVGLGPPPPPDPRGVALGLGFGLDYAWSRDFGLGVTARFADTLTRSTSATYEMLLRAEYRWGW